MPREEKVFIASPEVIDPEGFLIAKYYVKSELPLREAGVQIAKEESIGTWTEVKTTTLWAKLRLAAKVFKVEEDENIVYVAYPVELFDAEAGVANLLSIVAGNLFGLSSLERVRLLDIQIPKCLAEFYRGPRYGIGGIRKIAKTDASPRPHLGVIVKPKVGLNPEETAKVVYEAAMGGADFIKDDETLVNQPFCILEERVSKVMEALDKANQELSKKPLYAVNITASYRKMVKNAEVAKDNGANMLMIDIITVGFSAFESFMGEGFNLPIHAHRAMHAAMTRVPDHGISMLVFSKLARMIGADQLHIGAAAGKMGEKDERSLKELKENADALREGFYHYKPVFPVASGGIHPKLVPANVKFFGLDVIINAGGGVHGHPRGTRAGVRAMMQAIEASVKNIPLEEYARDHVELREAIEIWS